MTSPRRLSDIEDIGVGARLTFYVVHPDSLLLLLPELSFPVAMSLEGRVKR